MRPRPFYRWKSFWFGLLVLVFMGWASVDSRHYWTNLNLPPWHLERAYQVSFFSHDNLPTGRKRAPIEREARPESGHEGPGSPSFVRTGGVETLCLPDESILFPFLFAWIALLTWRWAKQNKAKESS